MSKDPRPDEDEQWNVEEELESEKDSEEIEEQESGGPLGLTRRQTVAGAGAAFVGLGGIAFASSNYSWSGGDVPNSTNETPDNDISGDNNIGDSSTVSPTETATLTQESSATPTLEPTETSTSEADPVLTPYPTPTRTSTPTPTPTPEGGDLTYQIEDVTVDLGALESIYKNSEVQIGVQENGNLVAWNSNVEIEDEDGDTYSPLYRFRSDLFPDPDFYDVDEPHPVQEIYQDSEAEVEEMTEGMVRVFYDEEEDEGSWKDHREYKPTAFEELRDGLIEYSSLGAAQDYFFNRTETLREGEGVLEGEWQELLHDSLEPENQN